MTGRRDDRSWADVPVALWAGFYASGDSTLRRRLVEHYLPWVRILAAGAYARQFMPSLAFMDFYQSGVAGLLEAVDRFDPGRGVDFKTFATRRIHGEMANAITQATEVDRQYRVRQRYLQSPAVIPDGERPFAQLMSRSISLAVGYMLEGSGMYLATGEGDEARTPPAVCLQQQWRALLLAAVGQLTPQQQRVIRLHYLGGMPFADIAVALDLSAGRVTQLHRQGLAVLRQRLPDIRDN